MSKSENQNSTGAFVFFFFPSARHDPRPQRPAPSASHASSQSLNTSTGSVKWSACVWYASPHAPHRAVASPCSRSIEHVTVRAPLQKGQLNDVSSLGAACCCIFLFSFYLCALFRRLSERFTEGGKGRGGGRHPRTFLGGGLALLLRLPIFFWRGRGGGDCESARAHARGGSASGAALKSGARAARAGGA